MSRGLGDMQNAILQLLKAAEGEVTIETMRWALYEDAGKPPVGARLDNSWNTSVSRAAKGLEDRELVVISPRRLETFEECVRHYPGKALQARKRELRKRFLPMLSASMRELGGISPRYSEAANEKFHLEQIQEEDIEDLTREWNRIEGWLRPIYGQALEFADEILCLICKGRRLFRCRGIQWDTPLIEVPTSLTLAIESVCRGNVLPSPLMAELQAFKEKFLSTHEAGLLKLKSFIHGIAEVPRHGKCTLRSSALKYLHENDQSFVEQMSGFKEQNNMPRFLYGGKAEYGDSRFFKYSPELVMLFDHTVFQEFNFISLAA